MYGLTGECRFWLARPQLPSPAVELVDGAHSDHAGVAEAAKLLGEIFGDRGPWLMVELHELPELDLPINEAAAAEYRAMLRGEGPPSAQNDNSDRDV